MSSVKRVNRSLIFSTLLAFSLLLTALFFGSAAQAQASKQKVFLKKPRVEDVSIFCVKSGANKGRVVVDARIRYSTINKQVEQQFMDGKQRVSDEVDLLTADGKLLASTHDHGSRQAIVDGLTHVDHLHRTVLSPAATTSVLKYSRGVVRCGQKAVVHKRVKVKVKATQSIKAPLNLVKVPPAKKSTATATTADTPATPRAVVKNSTSTTLFAAVTAKNGVNQVINGCTIAPETSCPGADLTGADLSGANLQNSVFLGASFKNTNLTNANFGGSDTNLMAVNFSGAKLDGAYFGFANLGTAKFNNKTSTVGTVFDNARMQGIFGTGANFAKASLQSVNLNQSNLNNAVLNQANVAFSILANVNMFKAKLVGTVGLDVAICNAGTRWPDGSSDHGTCPPPS